MREKKSSLHFSGRKHAKYGIASTVMGIIAWLVFAALCVSTISTGGNSESVVGIIGILDAIFALAGIYISMKGFREKDVYYVLPVSGLVLFGVLFVIYFVLYFMGAALV